MAKYDTKKPSPFSVFNLLLKGVKYEDLTNEDIKEYSQYMVNKIVSMDVNSVIYSNIIQKYMNDLPDKVHYEFYQNVLSRNMRYKFISSKGAKKYSDGLVELLSKRLRMSKKEINENLDVLIKVNEFNAVENYISKFGFDNKDVKQMLRIKK